MAIWAALPAVISAGASIYDIIQKRKSLGDLEGLWDDLKRMSETGMGMSRRQSLYGSRQRQISRQFGEARRRTGARAAATGILGSSTAGGAFTALEGQQAGANQAAMSEIDAWDQQIRDRARQMMMMVGGQKAEARAAIGGAVVNLGGQAAGALSGYMKGVDASKQTAEFAKQADIMDFDKLTEEKAIQFAYELKNAYPLSKEAQEYPGMVKDIYAGRMSPLDAARLKQLNLQNRELQLKNAYGGGTALGAGGGGGRGVLGPRGIEGEGMYSIGGFKSDLPGRRIFPGIKPSGEAKEFVRRGEEIVGLKDKSVEDWWKGYKSAFKYDQTGGKMGIDEEAIRRAALNVPEGAKNDMVAIIKREAEKRYGPNRIDKITFKRIYEDLYPELSKYLSWQELD